MQTPKAPWEEKGSEIKNYAAKFVYIVLLYCLICDYVAFFFIDFDASFFQLVMFVVSPNSLGCVWAIFKNGFIAPKLENVSFLFMVVAKEMPTTLIPRRSVKTLVQVI